MNRPYDDLAFPKFAADTYLSCPDVSDPDAFAARVHGDAMLPEYRHGDIMIFSPRSKVRNGDDAFVKFMDGQTTFKRVFFEVNEAGEDVVRLQPRNEKYRARVVRPDELDGIWRAVFRYSAVNV